VDYKNKSVLITGGTSGIGLELARILAARGARLFLFARSQDNLINTVNDLQTVQAGEYHGIPTDVSDANQVAQSVKQVIEMAGVPDLLIDCAGAAHPGYVQDLNLEIFRWMMDVNYFGAVFVTKAVLPGMIARKSGYIVNIASLAAVVGMYSYTAYGASKFALRGFSDALRMEMKPHGIQVSIVYPADTDTPQLTYENQYKPAELMEMGFTLSWTGCLRGHKDKFKARMEVKRKNKTIIEEQQLWIYLKSATISPLQKRPSKPAFILTLSH